jgi:hypothetical protein
MTAISKPFDNLYHQTSELLVNLNAHPERVAKHNAFVKLINTTSTTSRSRIS